MASRSNKRLIFLISIVLSMLAGCSVSVTSHDEQRAAEFVLSFLSKIQDENGVALAYKLTSADFKKEVSIDKFGAIVSEFRGLISNTNIQLIGYEVFGSEEMIILYGLSKNENLDVHLRFVLVGTKLKGYKLFSFGANVKKYSTSGIYYKYNSNFTIDDFK